MSHFFSWLAILVALVCLGGCHEPNSNAILQRIAAAKSVKVQITCRNMQLPAVSLDKTELLSNLSIESGLRRRGDLIDGVVSVLSFSCHYEDGSQFDFVVNGRLLTAELDGAEYECDIDGQSLYRFVERKLPEEVRVDHERLLEGSQ